MKLLVRGQQVYDGTGAPPQKADILIENGIIADVGTNLVTWHNLIRFPRDLTIIKGKVVCPGFIDIHRHPDAAVFSSPDFGKTELMQGITTVVMGNCGIAPVPGNHPWQHEHFRYIEPVIGPVLPGLPLENFHTYRQGLESLSLPVNLGFLAGAGAIKTAVKGFSKTPFTPEEMAKAQTYVKEALDAGALGLSFGLMYQPECYSNFDELCAMAKAASGTILCTHIRGEGDSLVDSVDEVIRIAENANLPVNISHFKSTGIKNWQRLIHKAIEKIQAARSRGLRITADFYPYNGGSTTILSLLPPTLLDDSIDVMSAKLADKQGRDLLRRELNKDHPGWDNMAASIGWDRIIISSVTLPENEHYCGKNMQVIASEQGFDDPVDLLAQLTASEQGKAGIITLGMDQKDIDIIARLSWTCLISDSLYSKAANPHPRLNGAFPKFLREYVRERRILSMQEAIHKMTLMPAERMGLKNRGKIAKGMAADLVVFDPKEFTDNASYSSSTALASGIGTVIVNGQIAYTKNKLYNGNGRVLSRSG